MSGWAQPVFAFPQPPTHQPTACEPCAARCLCRPTNSGKTYQALQALRRADSGVYAGPLRLLAWQVHDQLCAGGLPCSLVTGQERREMEGARHVACTAETASTRAVVDVAVRGTACMGGRCVAWQGACSTGLGQ